MWKNSPALLNYTQIKRTTILVFASTMYLQIETHAVFVLELQTSNMHAALGRLLDQTRVAGLPLAALSARADANACRISASIDINDRDVIDRLVRRVGALFCIDAIEVRGESQCPTPTSSVT
ncbi:hypothetical protein [Bradyrhizobium manausense]|uniref:hypothetical protein n=1 Tax=Bradyrhizobium manausense TaxID=989370 RepID=UPI001BA59314|nr:hypothetical protein [Bradyrhizobium manausense]MBR0725995.1 hypothetical protein [Bradyrhizobium manausense]